MFIKKLCFILCFLYTSAQANPLRITTYSSFQQSYRTRTNPQQPSQITFIYCDSQDPNALRAYSLFPPRPCPGKQKLRPIVFAHDPNNHSDGVFLQERWDKTFIPFIGTPSSYYPWDYGQVRFWLKQKETVPQESHSKPTEPSKPEILEKPINIMPVEEKPKVEGNSWYHFFIPTLWCYSEPPAKRHRSTRRGSCY